jgi:uncharacterized protein (DUF433 family)
MASRNLGSLTVDLLLELGGFKGGMDKAQRQTANFERQMKSRASAISGAFSQVGKVLAGVGIGFSAVGIVREMASAARAAIAFGDEINKATAKTGIGAERMSALAYAAKQADVDFAALGTSLKKMQVTLSEASSGTKSANETLAALGLTIEEIKRLAPEDQFELLADRISLLRDPADRTRAAVELFGRAGADLLPLFEQGAAGIRAAREEAERMGATLTGEQARALAEADDAVKRLGQAWDGLARTLTVAVAPSLINVATAMTNVLSKEPEVLSLAQAWEAVGRAFSKNGILGTGPLDILAELQAGSGPTAPLGSAARTLALSRRPAPPPAPGYRPEVKPPTAGGTKSRAAAAEVDALRGQADAYKEILASGMAAIEGLRTPVEEQIAQYQEAKYAIEQLAATYPNLADQAEEALGRLAAQDLEPIVITAEKIFPPAEREQLSEFWLEASRNTQNILADFLFDPFKDGLKGLAQSFADMLQRMAAEAVAAQIASKIFGTGGMGSGGGWLGTAMAAAKSYFGYAEGGYTGHGAKYKPAGAVHRGEYVVPKHVVEEPGALAFLRRFHEYGMDFLDGLPGFAGGGLVGATASAGITPAAAMRGVPNSSERAMGLVQHFTIQAPQGSVSRATQQQIGAQAYRGAARAAGRSA